MLVDVYRPLSGVCGFRSLPFFRVEVPVYYRSVLVVLDMCVHPTFFAVADLDVAEPAPAPLWATD